MNVHHILVPLDFSESTNATLQAAIELAEKFSARITLCHFIEPVFAPASELAFAFDRRNLEIQNGAEEQLRTLAKTFPSAVQVDTRAEAGIPWDGIVELTEKRRVDLIVMGTHGRSGLKHLWLGSVAERVVQHAPCAVFVVRTLPGVSGPEESKTIVACNASLVATAAT